MTSQVTMGLLLLLALSTSPAFADATLVAIAVTPSGDGVLTVPVGGDAAFAAAVINVGTTGIAYWPAVTVEAFEQSEFTATQVTLPLTVTICQTNSSTGQCLPNTIPGIAPGTIHTYSVFVHADGPMPPLSLYAARVVVTFHGTRPVTFPPRIVGPLATYTAASVGVRTVEP